MKRRVAKPTDSELEILNVLWSRGAMTVRDVHEVLEQHKEIGYTTTLKLLQIMHEKGLVSRNTDSKTHIYQAAVDQTETRGQLLDRMIETVFNGSASKLVLQALGQHQADADELRKIREYLDSLEQQSKS
jgi:predicted transcriptional regulator